MIYLKNMQNYFTGTSMHGLFEFTHTGSLNLIVNFIFHVCSSHTVTESCLLLLWHAYFVTGSSHLISLSVYIHNTKASKTT